MTQISFIMPDCKYNLFCLVNFDGILPTNNTKEKGNFLF